MGLVQPENTTSGGACHRGRTTYAHRNVIPFGVTGMPVKANERTGEDKGMKFVPLVEKNRICLHVEYSTRGGPLYTEPVAPGDADFSNCFVRSCLHAHLDSGSTSRLRPTHYNGYQPANPAHVWFRQVTAFPSAFIASTIITQDASESTPLSRRIGSVHPSRGAQRSTSGALMTVSRSYATTSRRHAAPSHLPLAAAEIKRLSVRRCAYDGFI